jgi:rhodanese-related sulfurtransferase
MSTSVPEVTVAEVGEDAYLLDVRDHDEWAAGHAPQAHHVPMMSCSAAGRAARRSRRGGGLPGRIPPAQVVAYLQQHGWDRISNLAGGMWAWQAAGRRMVSDDDGSAYVL